MRIAIFGTGGAGGRFGAQLARAGEEVVFIARGEHLRAIRTHGLRLLTPEDEIVVQPAQVSDDPAQVGVVDLVIVGVKSWQVKDAARAMTPMIGRKTFVLPLQNGIEAATQLSDVIGGEHVLAGLCATLSWVEGPGRIRSVGNAHFVRFGEQDNGASTRTARLRDVFERAGVVVDIPSDIHAALWEKFLFVVSLGGLGAVTRAPIGVIRSMPDTRRMLDRCMREIDAVARARQIALKEGIVEKTLAFVDSLDPNGSTSLQRDIVDGKPSELEAWNGAVVRAGHEVDVATPLHETIYHCLLPLELKARGTQPSPPS